MNGLTFMDLCLFWLTVILAAWKVMEIGIAIDSWLNKEFGKSIEEDGNY